MRENELNLPRGLGVGRVQFCIFLKGQYFSKGMVDFGMVNFGIIFLKGQYDVCHLDEVGGRLVPGLAQPTSQVG